MNMKRVIIQTNVVKAFCNLICLHKGDSIRASHRTVTHLGICSGELLNACPILFVLHIKQATNDSHIRTLPLVETDNSRQAKPNNHELYSILPRCLILRNANEGRNWLATEATYNESPDAKHNQYDKWNAENKTCSSLIEDVETMIGNSCHIG